MLARPADAPALAFLLVGIDSRSTVPITGADSTPGVDARSERSDVLMIAQIAADRHATSIVSIPRDRWVAIPDRSRNKADAGHAVGGPSLLIQTVEQLSDVHVDLFTASGFTRVQAMADAVGGELVRVAQATSNNGVVPAGA